MSSPASREYAYRALALLGLCALTSSSIAQANECDTPAAEPCACRSTVSSASVKTRAHSARRADAAAKQKKSAPAAKQALAQISR
jgi:hypothetical protein